MKKHVSLAVVVFLAFLTVVMPSIAVEPKSAQEALQNGKSFFNKRNFDAAIAAYTEAIWIAPRDDDVLMAKFAKE